MKLTDEQRYELVNLTDTHRLDPRWDRECDTCAVTWTAEHLADHLAPLIESWLTTQPKGWEESEEWQAPVLFGGGVYGPVSRERAAHMLRVEQQGGPKAQVRRRTIWVGPWEPA